MVNVVETTCLYVYTRPMKITYDQGSEFIGNDFRKSPIERQYSITAKPRTLVNPASDVILERIHNVLGNLLQPFTITQTYVDEDDLWLGILAVAELSIR